MITARRLLATALALWLAALPASAPAATKARPLANTDPVVTGRWRSPAAAPAASHPGRSGQLTAEERALAETAWRYLRNNTQPGTGLVNAVENYPSATLWDMGSAMAGVTAAQRLGLIDRADASARLRAMLDTLGRITLFRGLCPNKAYDTRDGERVDYANQPGEIGCSALDVGRLLVWLRITAQRYPELAAAVAPQSSSDDKNVQFDFMSEEDLLRGLENLAPPTETDDEGE